MLATLGGRADSRGVVHLDSLDLGGHRLVNVAASVLPAMDAIGAQVGAKIAGNLGYGFLHPWRVLLDYHHQRLHLVRPADSPAGVPFVTGPGGGLIQVEVALNDQGPYRFVLDTGASATGLAPTLARDLGLTGEVVEALAVTGPLSAQLTTMLGVAGHVLRDVTAAIIDIFEYTSRAAGAPIVGILGYSVLNHFLVEIDSPAKHLRLLPRAA